MKVVFLDFDGVLNDDAWMADAKEWFDAQKLAWWMPGPDSWRLINPELVARLNEIIAITGAVVVISSSWRNAVTLAELKEILVRQWFVGEIIGKTGRMGGGRGNEIQDWLDRNPGVESFVILDDDNDMLHLSDRLIRTEWKHGLQPEHVTQAVAMLEGK